jgi:tetratricopeptide (TPR) repeat protein
MSDTSGEQPGSDSQFSGRQQLDSWKEIAAYLDRDVRTVIRWEKKEGLPIHRHVHQKQASVYAYRSEIDTWRENRSITLENNKPGWFPFFSENKKTVAGVAGGVTLLLLAGLVAWMDIGSSSNPEGLSFQERDWVLIADFENRTGEVVFDGVLEYALEREITNSQFVNVVPRERIEDTLQLMRKALDSRIDRTLGREICLRDGDIKALLTGRVEKLDSTYLLSVQVVDPSQGQVVATASEEAVGQRQVLSALRSLSSWARENLGEKLALIQESERRLEKAATPSLRAVQLFTDARTLFDRGGVGHGPAEELLRQALEIDPEFASASIWLAWTLLNQRKPLDEYIQHAERAFQLAGTTSEQERYFIHGSYYWMKGELDRAIHAFQALLGLYPDHLWATRKLAELYRQTGQEREALAYNLRVADMRPTSFRHNYYAIEQLLLADHNFIRAKPYIERARNLTTTEMLQSDDYGRVLMLMFFPAYEAWLGGDPQAALVEIDKVLQTVKPAGVSSKHRAFGLLYELLGQRQLAREWMSTARWRSNRHYFLSRIAYDEGDYEAMKNHLKQHLEATRVSRANLYPLVAVMLARAGLMAESEKLLLELERQYTQPGFSPAMEMARDVLKLSQGDTAEGIAMLTSTLPHLTRRDRAWAFEILAEAYTRQGNLGAAIELLEEALEKLPFSSPFDSPSLWLRLRWQLADFYRQTGRDEDAREIEDELRTLLALADPDHPILRQLDRTEELALLEPTTN